jgi:hypothetical protein
MAIRAAAAAVSGFPILAVLIYVADEHPARSVGHWQIVLHLRTKMGIFVEERVEPPLTLVGVACEVFVSDSNVNAVLEVL